MKNRKFLLGMLVIVLTFGMTVTGCDDGSDDGKDNDTWSIVTSLSQLNGTWKGSYNLSNYEVYDGITMKISAEITMTIKATNATTGTMSGDQKMTMALSGKNIALYWPLIIEGLTSELEPGTYTVNNSNHSITITETISSQDISLSDMYGFQINQNGTKAKLPTDQIMDGLPEMIFIKQ